MVKDKNQTVEVELFSGYRINPPAKRDATTPPGGSNKIRPNEAHTRHVYLPLPTSLHTHARYPTRLR